MKIKDIRASVLSFPITVPLIDHPIDTYEIVFCEVETEDRIFKNPPWPEDNVVRIPDAPGLGLELDRDNVRAARVE